MKSLDHSSGDDRIGWCDSQPAVAGDHPCILRSCALPGSSPESSDWNTWSKPHGRRSLPVGLLLVGFIAFLLSGCSKEPQFHENQLEWVKVEKAAGLPKGQHFPPIHHQDVADIITAWFGTPDKPYLPLVEGEDDPLNELISLDNVKMSAGAVSSDRENRHQGLYREHCSHCHGITGDGAGPTASFLDPYPRDFRHGKFKFKKTVTGTPPTREDLKRILVNGVPGTAMPSFRLLSDEELDALVDYVIYLSMRGMTERLLVGSVRELGEDLPRLISLPEARRISEILYPSDEKPVESKATAAEAEASGTDVEVAGNEAEEEGPVEIPIPEKFDEEVVLEELAYMYEEQYFLVLEKWLSSLDFEDETPEAPEWIDDPSHEDYEEKILLGQTLYFGEANCKQCHGETGLGDGQINNYDDWTNDWLKVENLNPQDLASMEDYLKAGAFLPRPILPRNLRTGVYRGGDEPSDLFARIKNGIEGTPMPASLTLEDDEVWALVAFVRQMPYETISRPVSGKKTTNDKSIR